MPPSTEEIHLSEQQVALFICSYEGLDVRKTQIALTDTVPCTFPKGILICPTAIFSGTIQPALAIIPPVTVVAQVYLVIHVCITFGVVNSVVAPVPGCTIVGHLLVGDAVIDFLEISLEVAVVLESLILCHDRIRILIKPRGAGSKAYTAGQQEKRTV
jgi:hypothetical protein